MRKRNLIKDIPGYNGKYRIGEDGVVYRRQITYIKVKGFCDPTGYKSVRLYADGYSGVNMSIHRLVATVFIENKRNLPIVHHIDGNPSNNYKGNLEWSSYSHNNKHAYAVSREKYNPTIDIPKEQFVNLQDAKIANLSSKQELFVPYLYDPAYKVSNRGRILSVKQGKTKLLRQKQTRGGYCALSLLVTGRVKHVNIHRLVAEHFIPNPNNFKVVNHKNGIKTDNRVENLEYCSHSYNTQHAWNTGLITLTPTKLAKLHKYGFKPNRQQTYTEKLKRCRSNNPYQIAEISSNGRILKTWYFAKDVQQEMGINRKLIGLCAKGKITAVAGRIFRYVQEDNLGALKVVSV